MSSPISSSFLCFFLFSALLFLCSSGKLGMASEGTEAIESNDLNQIHTVQVSSLLPSTICGPSTNGSNRNTFLTVVHKYGPCSQLNRNSARAPTHAEILGQDESRVKWINSRLSNNLGAKKQKFPMAFTNIPAKSGATVGCANYVVTVGLGSPKKDLTLIFDTGSDLTWTQCEPCIGSCYEQMEQLFDPRASKTYKNITCKANVCSRLTSATGNTVPCSDSTCVYGIEYGDQSSSFGFFATERLALTSKGVVNNFLFGCGQNNQGLFVGAAGLIGLGRGSISLIQQTKSKYERFFSYCLPSTSSSTGHLTFGKSNRAKAVNKFTPFSKIFHRTSFYGLDTTGIFVRGRKLTISASVFSKSGTIIDSGTVITRLPPAAYNTMRTAFRAAMKKYPLTKPFSILDTCYDFTAYDEISFPEIAFSFRNGIKVNLDASGVFFAESIAQICLAFAANDNAEDVAIFGNVQQKTLEVVYDVAGGRVGFAPHGCR